MTLLITAAREHLIVSVADRRSSVRTGATFTPLDERFNKHVWFALNDPQHTKGTASFTGVAQWQQRSGKTTTTDAVIAAALGRVAVEGGTLGEALLAVARDLAQELRWLAANGLKAPTLTIVFAGHFESLAEPWLALMTASDIVPDWNEDKSQYEFKSVDPFRVHFAIICRPTVFVGGATYALPPGAASELQNLFTRSGVRAYDFANLGVRHIRRASARSSAVGARASAIVAPRPGSLDTGLWDLVAEPTMLAMPRIVFGNGAQIEPSEVRFEGVPNPGQLQRHSLWLPALLEDRTPRRLRRKLKRVRSSSRIPTVPELLAYVLFGKDVNDDDSTTDMSV